MTIRWYGLFTFCGFFTLAGCVNKCSVCSQASTEQQQPVAYAQSAVNASTASAQDVRIVTTEPDPRICDYISDAMGYALDRDLSKAQLTARSMLKREAFKMGGNTVRLDTNTVDDPGIIERGQIVLNGRVFKCDMQINPEDVLGKIQRTAPLPPKAQQPATGTTTQPTNQVNPQSTKGNVAPINQTTSPATSRTPSAINPPPPPRSFNEQDFLNSGEEEFQG